MPADTLTYNGKLFRLPFSHLFRAHTAAEEGEMRRSITEDGVVNPVQVYDSDAHGANCVISGERRLRYAGEIGVDDVPIHHRGRLDDETAHRLALNLNIAARHLSAEEIHAARRAKVVDLKVNEGLSNRAIADRLNVDEKQVRRDLAGADTVRTPETVTGRDGNTYPATKPPAPEKMPAADRAVADMLRGGETEDVSRLGGMVVAAAADPEAVAEALFAKIESRLSRERLIELVRAWLKRLEG